MRLFWVKMIQEIIFSQTRMFGYHGKWYFSENDFRLTNIFTFDPEMIFHPHFHFKSFLEREREREREREKREPRSRRSSIDDCDRWDRAVQSSIARRDRRLRSMRSHGAIVDRAARSTSTIDDRDQRAHSSDAHRSSDDRTDLASARCRLHRAISSSPPPDLIHFLLLRFVSFAEFDAFSVKIFEWTKHQN